MSHDVIVIGAGPAGATAAALLAERGLDVLVLEKDEFPRFKIGESLLPAVQPVLARLGIESMPGTSVYKRGARFVCEATGRESVFAFSEALPGSPPSAWHVERAKFDTLLRDRARELGADVRHGQTVVDAVARTNRVEVQTREGKHEGRYLIDASGQSRLLARRAEAVSHYDQFGHSAAFTHFEGLSPAAFDELGPDFDIRIMMRAEGWGWIIPLPGHRLSVGMVSKGKITPQELDDGLLSGPLCQRLTAGATRLETRVAGNFSYRNTAPSGVRYATAGDAACFLDPVFSSGVTLALRSAMSVADLVGDALEADREDEADLLADHQREMDRAYATFAGLIERFYNSRFAETMFLGDNPDTAIKSGVMSVLAGDVWRTGNDFQDMLLRARRRERSVRA
ncbi:MAG: FAD-dependent oxidoreductase [bacterium]|nr:FAD-dependent oxidoreductase [bacterium]